MFQFSSVAQSCPTLCNTMDCSSPGLPVHHQLPESTQTHVHQVGNAIHHLILCCPLLCLPPIPPSIRVFSNESTLCIRWPKYWSFSFNISLPVNTQDWSPLGWTGWMSGTVSPFRAEQGTSLETPWWARASSCQEVGTTWFFSSCGAFSSYDGDLSLPLGLALGSPIFPSGCEGKLGVALESLQGRRDLT